MWDLCVSVCVGMWCPHSRALSPVPHRWQYPALHQGLGLCLAVSPL